MKLLFTSLFRRKPHTIRKPRPARPLCLEHMEDRLTPANVWVSTNSTSTQEAVREYTQSGSLIQTFVIPASGPTDEDARDLTVASDGTVRVYNGTFDPVLSTYSAGSWSSQTYAGWSTANNVSYGGIARSGNYVFVTDMNTGSGDDTLKGIIRFNLADGTATRFATGYDYTDVAIGQNGRLYALTGSRTVKVFHPETLALEQTVTLPSSIGGVASDYRSITANAAGDLFLAHWNNQVHRFTSTGTLVNSLSLPTASIGNLTDIDLAADGTLAIGSRFGVVALTTENFDAPTYITVGTDNTFVAFREDAPPPPAPLPGFSVGNATVTEGNSGTTTAVFTVTLSEPLTEAASVSYASTAGSANGTDFTVATGTLTFDPGETSKTVSVNVLGDTTYELDETFYLSLSDTSTNASVIGAQGVGTILNDDPVPPTIVVDDATVTEGNSGTTLATFTLTLSFASTQTVSVNYSTLSGSGTPFYDYTTTSGTLTFAPGETTKTVSVPVLGDTIYEPNETFTLNLSSPTNVTIADSQGVGTIVDDDPVPPSLSISDVTVTEGNSGTTLATFTLTLSFAYSATASVYYSTSAGTASAGVDYATLSSTKLTFAPGETTKTVSVSVYGDTTYEPNETFTLNLASPTNLIIADNQAVGTIANDDPNPPSVSVNDVTVAEGNSGTSYATFTVNLSYASPSNVSVYYSTATGTASSSSDYSTTSGTLTFAPGETTKTVNVPVVGDATYEPNETFTLNLSSASGATIADSQGLATITNDDAIPTIAVNDVTLVEGNSGTTYATFTVTLTGSASQTVQVSYATASGTATSGSDFTAQSGTLYFYSGQTTKTVQVPVIGNVVLEPNETFYLNLTSATNAALADNQGVATILNDDSPPTVRVANNSTAVERNAGTSIRSFTVQLSYTPTETITVDYATVDGTATAGSDYQAVSGTLTFTPGSSTSRTVSVVVYGDTMYEPDETFTLALSNPINTTIYNSQGLATIVNDDTAAPTLTIGNVSVTEGNSGSTTATFTVSLAPTTSSTVTVNYSTTPGSALAGTDFIATSGTLTFAPGESTKTVTVTVLGDTTYEVNEVFALTLSNAVNATIGVVNGVATIVNDDTAPRLSISDASVIEGNSSTANLTFQVSLSNPSYQTIAVNYATQDGLANAGSDYTSTSGSLSFAPGETTKTVTVPVLGDTEYELDEWVYLNLSNLTNATFADSSGTGTILNDDPTPPSVTIDDVSVIEGDSGTTPAVFTVSLSHASNQPITVDYTTSPGSATADSDYTSTSGTLTFLPGETTKTVAVDVLGDLVVEGDESFSLSLSNVTNASLADSSGVATILTDDILPNLAISAPTVTEGDTGSTLATFTLTLSQAASQTVTLDYATTAGTATSGIDYAAASGSLTFAPGETTKTVTVEIYTDVVDEENEAFTLTLSNLVNVGTVTGSGQATIVDDDVATFSISDVSVIEGNSGTTAAVFTVTLSNPSAWPISVAYATAGDTATSGTDFTTASGTLSFLSGEMTKTITVLVKGDTTPEADETFAVNLSNPANAAIGDGQGVGTILDDEPPVISVEDITTDEGDSGTTPAVFTVTLSKPSTETVTVQYVFNFDNNTATRGVDFDGPTGTLTFAPGETIKTITATIYGDILTEEDETYQFTLSNATNAVLARSVIEGTIHNDDTTPTLNVDSVFVPEGNSGTTPMVFTVSLTSASTEPVTVDYATSSLPGNAVAGEDYLATSGTLTFAPGETTKTVTVTLLGDVVEEWGEELYLTLTNPVGAPIHHAQGRGVISNDDTARLVADDTTIIEGDSGTSYAAITVRLTTPSTRSISVNYETSGSNAMLIPGVDYTPTSGTLTFAPGETEKTVLVPVAGDLVDEPDETFQLNLFGPADAPILDERGDCTIIDNDTPTYSVADVTVTETDSGSQSVTVTIVSSNPNSRPDVLNYSVVAGTATAGTDFSTGGGTLNWAIGETTKTITVYVYGDTIDEPDETVLVNISGPFYGVVGDGQGVLTIVDNDVANSAPTARITPPSGPIGEGLSATFSGASSTDPEGGALTYSWNIGGTTLTGSSVS